MKSLEKNQSHPSFVRYSQNVGGLVFLTCCVAKFSNAMSRVDLNPLKKKATSSELRNVTIVPTLFLKWYQKQGLRVEFLLKTESGYLRDAEVT